MNLSHETPFAHCENLCTGITLIFTRTLKYKTFDVLMENWEKLTIYKGIIHGIWQNPRHLHLYCRHLFCLWRQELLDYLVLPCCRIPCHTLLFSLVSTPVFLSSFVYIMLNIRKIFSILNCHPLRPSVIST